MSLLVLGARDCTWPLVEYEHVEGRIHSIFGQVRWEWCSQRAFQMLVR